MRRLTWLPLALFGLAAACETMSPTEPGALVPRTVTEDPSLPAIEMNGARFHVQTFGNPANPAIVFLHGGPGGDYRSLLRLGERQNAYSLADDHFLIFWDQRGSGRSENGSESSWKLVVTLYGSALRYVEIPASCTSIRGMMYDPRPV